MAKKVTKMAVEKPKKDVEEKVETIEEDVVDVASSQDSEESDEDDIEGFSDEDKSSTTHKIKKLDPKKRNEKRGQGRKDKRIIWDHLC